MAKRKIASNVNPNEATTRRGRRKRVAASSRGVGGAVGREIPLIFADIVM
jgi:hypothetical protein